MKQVQQSRGSFRCFLGFHKWNTIGYDSLLNPMPIQRCDRCGRGRMFHAMTCAEFVWSAEEMDQLMKGIIQGKVQP